ncbi:MAG TPA: trypsin-like serine protease, partial [Pseudonocardiaceae bacterium]|nr:trypsin-like serine protease [Pseudonocardiaceae bacterium]
MAASVVVMMVGMVAGLAGAAADPVAGDNPQERASRLPVELRLAIERDLAMSPVDYLRAADAAARAAGMARDLRARLGQRVGGAWLDTDTVTAGAGALNVAVTDVDAGRAVQAAGGVPQLRSITDDDLTAGQEAVGRWALALPDAERALFHAVTADVRGGQVVVRISDGEAGRALAGKLPPAGRAPIVVDFAAGGPPVAHLRGGEVIRFSPGDTPDAQQSATCTLGFNAVDTGGRAHLLTAGHCAEGRPSVFTEDGTPIGTVQTHVFDDLDVGGQGDDYAVVAVTNPALRPTPDVDNHDGAAVDVHGAVAPLAGMAICKSGRSTGWTCGTIKQARVEILTSPPDGPQRLISVLQHDACSRPGDSGGSVLTGNSAVGLTQGGVLGPTPQQCPSDIGQPNFSVSEILVDDVLGDFTGDSALTLLTTTGDADGDRVRDVEELAADPTAVRDDNGDGIAAFLDPDEPGLRAPVVTEPADGARTTDTTPALSGTGRAGATVLVAVDGGEPVTAPVRRDGRWRVQAGELPIGAHELTARLTAGDIASQTTTVGFTVAPPPPVIASPGDGTVAGERRPQVSGTGLAGAAVTVTVSGVAAATARTTVGPSGRWSLELGADLP